ncbi:MAG TPA: tetratricopeptide repeat protein, partial [bacterium]|nr:tetratricopeptide repeat protein [bacterium]
MPCSGSGRVQKDVMSCTMRIPTIAAGLGALLMMSCACRGQDPAVEYRQLLTRGNDKLLQGDLLAARRAFEELYDYLIEDGVAATDRFRIAAEVGLQQIEIRQGHYESAQKALLALPAAARADRAVALLLAEAHWRIGEYEDAIVRLRRLVAEDGDDRQARHLLGAVLALAGQREKAREQWRQNAALEPAADGLQLAYQARSLFRLGGRERFERASRLLVQSMAKAPERPEARTTYGELLFRAYGEAAGFPSGERELKKVLAQNGDDEQALLAMYRLRSANMVLDAGKTERYLDRVLDRNPRCVDALLLRAASVLDDRRFETAARLLDEVLDIDPNHRATLCHRAAAALLRNRDDEYRRWRERALAGDAGWPECDRIIGDHLVRLYRFADAVPFFEAALENAPDYVPAMHGLARALIYVGQGARARELLVRAKELEPGLVDPWRNNAIAVQDLLAEQYDAVEHGPFTLLLHRSDRDVLREYLLPIHLEAVEVLGRKYGWQPDAKTTVEVFHTWDDFSVRTIGFRGFTALGACFGRLITLVSPVDNDLRKQDFMWEATAWHEYTHVLTLGLSRHRVPRWLTEGFSVYEERARDRSWERGMQRELFDAFHSRDI